MNSADQLLRLFEYDRWANEEVISTIQKHLPFADDAQCIKYLAHITGSQEVWYNRITGNTNNEIEPWADYTLQEALQRLNTVNSNIKRLIGSNKHTLDKEIAYQNSKGVPYETKLCDILHHVVIHGQHHRAQIAKLLRNAKIAPPATDFIFFSRTN